MGSYEVDLDGQTTAPVSAFAQTNSTNYRLYSSGPLTNGAHTIVLRNRGAVGSSGAELLLDYAQLTTVDKVARFVPLSSCLGLTGRGTSVKPSNVTVEDNDYVRLNYVGSWDSNNDTRFSGNTSTYTNGQGASVSLSFVGTAVYLYGDTVFVRLLPTCLDRKLILEFQDHGLFSVALDGGAPTTHNASTTFLEIGVLKYFETGLANVSHSLVVTNLGQGTYFGESLPCPHLRGLPCPLHATLPLESTSRPLSHPAPWTPC